MGRMLIRQIASSEGANLAAAVDRAGGEYIGQDAGVLAGVAALGLAVSDDADAAIARADVAIDFSSGGATRAHALSAATHGTSLVIGTTALDADDEEAIAVAALSVPIVVAANFSVGVVLLAALVKQAAETLGAVSDIEIVEMHHRSKVDAPSGTALYLGEAAAVGCGIDLSEQSIRGRDGLTGAREKGKIGFASLRGGDVVGDHTVIFAGSGERLELTHRAANREIFAEGAVRAALWAAGRAPGRYGMTDVLGLT
jgi:4-hydroxy-tetrahydrodipicolinate reductase